MTNEQGTEGWFEDRLGNATASRIKDAVAKTKTGWSASRAKYMTELVTERISGKRVQSFRSTAAMDWGNEMEALAASAYEDRTGVLVDTTGYVPHPTIKRSGASPDRLVGTDGLIEIKCPESHTHIDTLIRQRIPPQYVKQMLWQLACTGRKWCDFVSFDPRLPEGLQYFSQRLVRDDAAISELEKEIEQFLVETAELEQQLRGLMD